MSGDWVGRKKGWGKEGPWERKGKQKGTKGEKQQQEHLIEKGTF
jgi:hypothetical protein